MATGTPTAPERPAAPPEQSQVVAFGDYIEQQLHKTRNQVKWIEVTGALMTALAGSLMFFLAAVIIDHWIMPLGFWGRLLMLATFVAGSAWFGVRILLPALLGKVNPVFAAYAIEQGTPTLKNSLLNLLLLRKTGEDVPQAVVRVVEQQAASRLAGVSVESTIDRSRLIRIGYVLLALMTLASVYLWQSPKDPLQTVGRIMAPWAEIAAPTRVLIEEVTPGDTSVFTDEFVTVKATVRGLDDKEDVTLVFSSLAGEFERQAMPMDRIKPHLFEKVFPFSTTGLQEAVRYHVEAGDTRSASYQVEVQIPPSITITQVDYEYPAYTERPPQSSDVGEIIAPEGTHVTVYAESNQPIATAYVDFQCDGVKELPMQIDGSRASVRFPLRLTDGQSEYADYQIRFTNQAGHENPHPIRHSIEVLADEPPEVEIVSPAERTVQVPLGGGLPIEVHAQDADYAVSQVVLLFEHGARPGDVLHQAVLLDENSVDPVQLDYVFRPHEYQVRTPEALRDVKVGDKIYFWAVARDNRHQGNVLQPNVTRAPAQGDARYVIEVVAPDNPQQAEQGNDPAADKPEKPPGRPGKTGRRKPTPRRCPR